MMRTDLSPFELPAWLKFNLPVFGAEEQNDGDDGDDSNNDDGDDDDDDTDDSDKDKKAGKANDSEDDDDDDDDGDDKSTAGLRSALAKERKERRDLARRLKDIEREKNRATKKDTRSLEEARTQLAASDTKIERLAAGFRKSAENSAIERIARDLGFRDVDDALKLVDRSVIDVDQDEDDPSKVDIDADSVKDAVKALAKKKKHLIKSGTDDDEPTGSQFGRGKKKGQPDVSQKYRI